MNNSTTEDRFAALVDAFVKLPGVTFGNSGGKGFGASALKINGKMFALISSKRQFVVKLPRQRVIELIVAGEGEAFNHFGRIYKEWVAVNSPSDERWHAIAKEAMDFVDSLQK